MVDERDPHLTNRSVTTFIGVDVQSARTCSFAVLDRNGRMVDSGWVVGRRPLEIGKEIRELVGKQVEGHPETVAIGIDSPEKPMTRPRRWFWAGVARSAAAMGWGRSSSRGQCRTIRCYSGRSEVRLGRI